MLKIAILSYADFNNYGDTFFPIVMREELKNRLPDAHVELFTNIEFDCGLYKTTVYNKEYLHDFDAIILGGGELISPYDDNHNLEFYTRRGFVGKPSDIGHGWIDLQKPFKSWFSVGAHPVLYDYPNIVDDAMKCLDSICVRGTISKKVLEKYLHLNDGKIRVIPDLGWLFTRYIDEFSITTNILDELNGQQFIAFQVIDDLDIDTKAEMVAQSLMSFQKSNNVRVLLVPIMQTKEQWFESSAIRKIHDASDGILKLLPEGLNVLETGAILKQAKFFVGSSLHGAITALAYGKPAFNIRSAINTKLQDLHAARFRSVCFANDWSVLPGVLERLNNEAENENDSKHNLMYAKYMQYRLDKEFDNLAANITHRQQQ